MVGDLFGTCDGDTKAMMFTRVGILDYSKLGPVLLCINIKIVRVTMTAVWVLSLI